jgi:hypothetical protein
MRSNCETRFANVDAPSGRAYLGHSAGLTLNSTPLQAVQWNITNFCRAHSKLQLKATKANAGLHPTFV